MRSDWQLVLNGSSVEFLLGCKSRDRAALVKALQTLAAHPHQEGDFHGHDSTGRPVNLKVFGKFIITFWLDDFVKEVRILRIERV